MAKEEVPPLQRPERPFLVALGLGSPKGHHTRGTHTAGGVRGGIYFTELLSNSTVADTSVTLSWASRLNGLRLLPAALTASGRCLFLHKVLVEGCLAEGTRNFFYFPNPAGSCMPR